MHNLEELVIDHENVHDKMSAKVSAEEFQDYIGDEVDRTGKYGKYSSSLVVES